MIRCLSENRPEAFIYIPNNYFFTDKYDYNLIRFYVINNTKDTIQTTDFGYSHYITSSVATSSPNPASKKQTPQWLKFQDVMFEGCGNSYWAVKIPPQEVMEGRIDSQYFGMGDYRLELKSDEHHLCSNPIKIRVFKEQLKYMGTDHLAAYRY